MSRLLFLAFVIVWTNSAFAQDVSQPTSALPDTASTTPVAPACPYQVKEKDNIYFQVTAYNLKPESVNLNLQPYFRLYEQETENTSNLVRQTYSLKGTQHEETIDSSSYYQIWLEDNKTYSIDILSDWGNVIVCKGTINIPSNPLIVWAKNNTNKGKKYNIFVSKGNSVDLEFKYEKKGFYYFEIVSYNINKIDDTFYKYIENNYFSWLSIKNKDKEFCLKNLNFKNGALTQVEDTPSEKEFLLPFTKGVDCEFTIHNKMGELCKIAQKTEDIFKELSGVMNANPTDSSAWVISVKDDKGNDITLKFAGIKRLYMLKEIAIPANNPIRTAIPPNPIPKYRVYLDENGKSLGSVNAGIKAWLLDFPQDNNNIFEVREGINATYYIHIKNIDTWFKETHIIDIGNLKDLDLKQTISENVGSMGNPASAAKIRFQLLDN